MTGFTDTQNLDKCSASPSFTLGCSSYDCENTIKHHQLRDLVCSADNAHQFYCVKDNRVVQYDTQLNKSTVVQSLHFCPTSMTARYGYVAAGGNMSELEVKSLETDSTIFSANISRDTTNNALHIAKDSSGATRLFVCNNDSNIRTFNLSDMRMTTSHVHRCEVPMNYSALNPEGQLLLCVGDYRLIQVLQLTPTGYVSTAKYLEAEDNGMCCAWSPSGRLFAGAFQCGTTCVWDHTSGKVVAKLHMRTTPCRNVKFSCAPVDLLAFSEHVNRVHLVDSRRWDSIQTLHIQGSSPHEQTHISGLSFTPKGSKLYVGASSKVNAYDIDTAGRRTFSFGELV